MNLAEKYRPKTFGAVIGQEKAVSRLQAACKTGATGKAFWIAGPSGTGKTTLARIIAGQVATDWDIHETVARQLTPVTLREITGRWIYAGGHALIVNEAHGLSKPLVELFLDILEGLPGNVVVIFTTTNDGADLFEEHLDAGPFRSRCIAVKLTNQGLAPIFAAHAKQIAESEGLDGQPLSAYVNLVKQERNNLRSVLSEIEAGAMADCR
jgi:replication-associated recombination protein RarA